MVSSKKNVCLSSALRAIWSERRVQRAASGLFYGASVLAIGTGTAFGQQAEQLPSGVLEQVTVTANKREENVQTVSSSIQVVTPDSLNRANVADIGDLRRIAPAVQGAGQTLSMRGVSTSATSISAQNKVGVTLDDIPQPSRATLANNLQDVERVEVLPGPQGTLSGRNATGGLINIVTRGPSSEWTGSANMLATTDVERQFSGFLAGPISDSLQMSFSAFYKNFQGLQKNITLDKWSERQTWGARGKLQFTPTENLTLLATAFYQRSDFDGVVGGSAAVGGGNAPLYLRVSPDIRVIVDNTPGRPFTPFEQHRPGITPGPDNEHFASPLNGTAVIEDEGAILRAEWEVGNNMLTAIVSRMTEDDPIQSDAFATTLQPNQLNVRPEFDGFNYFFNGTKYKTAELRLNSLGESALRYVAGVFYSDLSQQFNYNRWFLPVDWLRDFGTESYSGYGHADFDITDKLTIQGGVRYERDKIGYKWTFLPIGPAFKLDDRGVRLDYPTVNPLIVSQNETDDDFVNYDLGVQYKLLDDVMIYAKYAKANQGPVFDAEDNVVAYGGGTQATVGQLQPLGQEKVQAIEVGVKSMLLDQRLTLNVSLFHQTYDNFQAQTIILPDDPTLVPILKLAAVGEVRTRGIEGTVNALLPRDFSVEANFAYTEAEILSFPNAPCYTGQTVETGCLPLPQGGTSQGDLGGSTLANAPKVKGNVILKYDRALAGDLDLFGAIEGRYISKVNTNVLGSPNTRLGDRTFVNLNFGIRTGSTSVELFVNNLFEDEEEAYGINNFGDVGSIIHTRTIDRDNTRYGGIRLTASF